MSLQQRKAAKAALDREQELMAAIEKRGKETGMSYEQIADAREAARAEIRKRGMSYEQIIGDLPASPVECCGDCYEDFMDN